MSNWTIKPEAAAIVAEWWHEHIEASVTVFIAEDHLEKIWAGSRIGIRDRVREVFDGQGGDGITDEQVEVLAIAKFEEYEQYAIEVREIEVQESYRLRLGSFPMTDVWECPSPEYTWTTPDLPRIGAAYHETHSGGFHDPAWPSFSNPDSKQYQGQNRPGARTRGGSGRNWV